ncbi:MAG: hypothetical protein H7Y88_02115, partial [Phycisphaerales bacterium]|nr:hypothetical protein [Phycisphaerales bacterium]
MASTYLKAGQKYYYATYRGPNGGRVHRSTRTTDKRAAQRQAAAWEEHARKVREGLIDPGAETIAQQRKRPIAEHVNEYIDSLHDKGSSARHVTETRAYIDSAVKALSWQTLRDIEAVKLQGHLAQHMRTAGTGVRSLNAKLVAIKGLTRWCVCHGRLASDPLGTLSKRSEAQDPRWVRRILTETEFGALLAATAGAPAICGMTGTDRVMLYRVLSVTGLRRGEAASLTPAGFQLNASGGPVVAVAAASTKNRRAAVQPLPAAVAALLGPWLASRGKDALLWPLPDKPRLRVLIPDLQRAGIDPGNWRAGEAV